jgi:hypothetical protein
MDDVGHDPLLPPSATDADAVIATLLAGARAMRQAPCRRASTDVIEPPGRLIATGDLHDNPMHLKALLGLAGLTESGEIQPPAAHLVLHELIHSDRLINGMDLSYRMLLRAAHLKARYPQHLHILLGNHELAQISGSGIIKDGVRSVDAFNAGVEYVFGARADDIHAALAVFIRAMPLALRCHTSRGDMLIAHSLPPAAIMQRFDPAVLSRELTDADYEPRRGSAHIMVWGRGYDAELLEDLVERWGVYLFILGHEKVDEGVTLVKPNALVLNSDHARGCYLAIDLEHAPTPEQALAEARPLASI